MNAITNITITFMFMFWLPLLILSVHLGFYFANTFRLFYKGRPYKQSPVMGSGLTGNWVPFMEKSQTT